MTSEKKRKAARMSQGDNELTVDSENGNENERGSSEDENEQDVASKEKVTKSKAAPTKRTRQYLNATTAATNTTTATAPLLIPSTSGDQLKQIFLTVDKMMKLMTAQQEKLSKLEVNLMVRIEKLEKQLTKLVRNPTMSDWWHEPVLKAMNTVLTDLKNPTDEECKTGINRILKVEEFGYTVDEFWQIIHSYVDKHCRDRRGRWSMDARKAFAKENGLTKISPLTDRVRVLHDNYATKSALEKFAKDFVFHRNPSPSDMTFIHSVLLHYSKGKRLNEANETVGEEEAENDEPVNWEWTFLIRQ